MDPNNPQSWNRYAYVLNNPTALADPFGLFATDPGICSTSAGTVVCTVTVTGSMPSTDNGFDPTGVYFGPNNSPGGGGAVVAADRVPANPCQYAGRALAPDDYASQGNADNGHPFTIVLNSITGFPRGHFFDVQPLAAGNVLQRAAYGNYVFGVYMAAAGISLSTTLARANEYALLSGAKYNTKINGPMDSHYGSLPAANVANITNGYNAERNGTMCSKPPLFPPPPPPSL